MRQVHHGFALPLFVASMLATSLGCGDSSSGTANSGGASGVTSGGPGATDGTQVSSTVTGSTTTSTSSTSSGAGGNSACGGIAIPMGLGGPSGGTVDAWTNVTPAGVTLDPNDFGAQDVVVDPVRPSDLYTFICHQGVWKSTDYGQTWAKVNTGSNGSAIDGGKPWSAGIDSNRCRDPNTPPTLYTFQGAGSQTGFWRSENGGVDWSRFDLPANTGGQYPQDGYSVDVDPYDGHHLIVGFHEETGFAESHDGGTTWSAITFDPGMQSGVSWYGFFLDTGDAVSTGKSWLLIPQGTGGGIGTWRTTDGGATWTHVESNEHPHGNAQIFQNGTSVFMTGIYGSNGWGVYRSTDLGATWAHVGSGASGSTVYGTAQNIYTQYAWADGGGVDQSQSQKAVAPGTDWSVWGLTMSNGPKHAAVTFDGAHYIVVGGNWNAGIWRYVEP